MFILILFSLLNYYISDFSYLLLNLCILIYKIYKYIISLNNYYSMLILTFLFENPFKILFIYDLKIS